MKNLSFSVLLAPYRVDYFNYLHDNFNCDIFFQKKGFRGQLFSTEELYKKCTYIPKYLKIIKLPGDRQIAFGLCKILKEAKADFVIVPEFSILTIQIILLKLILRLKFKIVIKCDDSLDMLQGGLNFSKLHGMAGKLCMPFAHNIILTDKGATGWYQSHFGKGLWLPIIIDEAGIDETMTTSICDYSISIRSENKMDGHKSILFVGRLVDQKNLPLLFETCKNLDFSYKLYIIGEGVLRSELERLAETSGINIAFIGQKNGIELYGWYKACDLFVLPSKLEPFGAVTNEALIFGTPCVVSDKAGSSCLIEPGVNGYLFESGSVSDLKNKITEALKLPKQNGSLMKKTFAEYMNVLTEVLGND